MILSIGSDSITLPNPDLGDGLNLNIKVKYNKTMTGDTYSYIKTPTTRKLVLKISNCALSVFRLLCTFCDDHANEVIDLEDWEGNNRQVRLINFPLSATVTGHNECEDFVSFNFDLEEVI